MIGQRLSMRFNGMQWADVRIKIISVERFQWGFSMSDKKSGEASAGAKSRFKAAAAKKDAVKQPNDAQEIVPSVVVDQADTPVAPQGPAASTADPASISRGKASTQSANSSSQASAHSTSSLNFENLAQNMARMFDEGGKILSVYANAKTENNSQNSAEIADAVKTLGTVAESWISDPAKAMEAQTALSSSFIDLWRNTLHRLAGDETKPMIEPDPSDKRFADPEWRSNPYFDFLRQAYTVTSNWANAMVDTAQGIDPHTRDKASFYVRQLSAALAPSNFLVTNPELLRATIAQDGGNLVRGMHMLAEDLQAGNGQLKIRQSDSSKFEVGVNLALTPGKVVFRNDLIELNQYSPTTETVLKRPLLIVPPWINKFYVLDLNPEKSFIRWAVDQGLSVFVVSWINPDERQADKSFESYMREGIFAALDAIEAQTGEKHVGAIGYCVGGTLLSATLAYMAATNDDRIASATLLTTQVDFTDPGDLKVFVDEAQLRETEEKMAKLGYLEGSSMANAFNMLRPSDLIWSYVIKNYMKGEPPTAFDLLYWNADSTRMPAANHSFYLRHCYLNNDLVNRRMPIGNIMLDLSKVKIPIYNLAAKEDHIAPAQSVFRGAQFFGGEMSYVLSGSGHIAGVVNPPHKRKYQYWTGPAPKGKLEDWLPQAVEHPGSWWPNWLEWYKLQAPETAAARDPLKGKLSPLCDAPGTYVKIRG